MEARNIQWENTDGQIVREFSELLIGANRVSRAEMYFEGKSDGYRIVTYPTPGKPDFVAIETGSLLEIIFYGLDPDSENAEYIPYNKSVFSEFIDAAANPDIAISDADAPVRYFNLQGIETANPAPGNIYIRVQGKNVTKTIMK